MKIQVNHQNLMNNNQKPKYQNYILNENNNYISGIKYKHEIKINQSSTKQAPIKKFMKQNHQRKIKIIIGLYNILLKENIIPFIFMKKNFIIINWIIFLKNLI